MSEVSTIKAGIKTRVASVLGGTYSELPHTIDIEKNNLRANSLGYGVLAGPLLQDESFGVIRAYSVSQSFTIKITDTFNTKPTEDADRTQTLDDLMDKALDIHKDLINTRAGTASLVIHVTDLELEETEVFEKSNVAVIIMNVTIKYRKAL